MKRNVKNVILVVIAIMLLELLGGCYCCPTCPIYPQEEWTVEITGQKPYCIEEEGEQKGFLADMRNIAPLAYHRYSAEPISKFTSLKTAQKVIDTLEGKDIVNEFLSFPGCENLPFGVIKHYDGSEEYIVAVINEEDKVEFYVLNENSTLVKIFADDTKAEIDFY